MRLALENTFPFTIICYADRAVSHSFKGFNQCMGLSESCILVRTEHPDKFLELYDFEKTGEECTLLEEEFAYVDLNNGWHLIVSNNCDYFTKTTKRLKWASFLGETVSSCLEEHVMCSSVEFWKAGRQAWSIKHGFTRSEKDLHTKGNLPDFIESIRNAASRKAKDDSSVDFFFDIPADVVHYLTGYPGSSLQANNLKFLSLRSTKGPTQLEVVLDCLSPVLIPAGFSYIQTRRVFARQRGGVVDYIYPKLKNRAPIVDVYFHLGVGAEAVEKLYREIVSGGIGESAIGSSTIGIASFNMALGNSYPFNLSQGTWSINTQNPESILRGEKKLESFFQDYAFKWFNRFETVDSIFAALQSYKFKSRIHDGLGHLENAFVIALLKNDKELLHQVIEKYNTAGSGSQQSAHEFYLKAQMAYPEFFTQNLAEFSEPNQ